MFQKKKKKEEEEGEKNRKETDDKPAFSSPNQISVPLLVTCKSMDRLFVAQTEV